jgi:hypothetical protein
MGPPDRAKPAGYWPPALTVVSCGADSGCTIVDYIFSGIPSLPDTPVDEHYNGHQWVVQPGPNLTRPPGLEALARWSHHAVGPPDLLR